MKQCNLQLESFPKKFPCGEVYVRTSKGLALNNSSIGDHIVTIKKHIQNSDDIMEILMLNDAIRRVGHTRIRLVMPYVPYSRQDRVMNPGESLSIKVFADLINSCHFEEVEIWDPHSDVTSALINNISAASQEDCLTWTLLGNRTYGIGIKDSVSVSDSILICPDAGARKKVLKLAQHFGIKRVIYADKVRELATGNILKTTIDFGGLTFDSDVNFLIIDDICDGGRTFIEIVKVLYQALSPENSFKAYFHLHVTHGFFTQGLDTLEQYFDRITCCNMMNPDLLMDLRLQYYASV
jgi:ribose-phosphate pyrophosphokinase